MKIMVCGVGGVGNYLAYLLCANNKTGNKITLVARGKRKEALEKNGVVIHSELLGEQTVRPDAIIQTPAPAGEQDIIFICVKNYSLPSALSSLGPCLNAQTIVVPILNGIDHYQVTKAFLTRGRILNSLIYIYGSVNADYSSNQAGHKVLLYLGGPEKEALATVQSLLSCPGITCSATEAIETELWKKYIANCGFNVITAYYRCDVQGIKDQPSRLQEYKELLKEAYQTGLAAGIDLPEHWPETIFHQVIDHSNPHNTSSMAQDVLAGRPIELETFGGYLLQLAQKLKVSVPVTQHIYEAMKKQNL